MRFVKQQIESCHEIGVGLVIALADQFEQVPPSQQCLKTMNGLEMLDNQLIEPSDNVRHHHIA